MPTKKYLRKKAEQIMFNRRNYDQNSQLSGILTVLLNPRDCSQGHLGQYNLKGSVCKTNLLKRVCKKIL